MAFIGATNPTLVTALMQNQQPISTGPTRSQLVNQYLQSRAPGGQAPVYSIGQGLAQVGSRLVDALMAKKGIDEQMQQQKALGLQDQARKNLLAQALGVPAGLDEQSMFGVASYIQQQKQNKMAAEKIAAEQAKAASMAAAKAQEEERKIQQQALENKIKERETALKERQATPEYKAEVRAAETRAAGEEKAILEAPEKIVALEGFRGGLDRTRQLIQELKDHPSRKSATGFIDAQTLSVLPGTRDFDAKLKELKGQLTLDRLAQAKNSGVSFGALSGQELNLTAESAGALDPMAGDDAFLGQLVRLEKRLDSAISAVDKDIAGRREKLPIKTYEELRAEIYQ